MVLLALEKACGNYPNLKQAEVQSLNFREAIAIARPGYKFYPFNKLIIHTLERVASGEIKRLQIWTPPQHGKSELASRLFPAYYLHKHPTRKVAITSYGSGIAYGLSRSARSNFRSLGGELKPDARAIKQWETIDGGMLWAAGVGGELTSKGFDLGIIDDPLKGFEQSQSPKIREKQQTWYGTDFQTRGSDDAAIVVINTRWNLSDLSGWLIQQEKELSDPEQWHILMLPAIREQVSLEWLPESCVLIPEEYPDDRGEMVPLRAIGEPACPERFSLKTLLKRKASLSPYFWNALYQQMPVEDAGTIFKREHFHFYQQIPQGLLKPIISVDATFKETVSGSFVAIRLWAKHQLGFVLLDSTIERMGFEASVQAIRAMLFKWSQRFEGIEILIETKANGEAIIESLSRELGSNRVHGFNPGSDSKAARARAVEPIYVRGEVWWPDPAIAPWVKDSIDRYLAFPLGSADDDVDADTQALVYLSGNQSVEEQFRGYFTEELI